MENDLSKSDKSEEKGKVTNATQNKYFLIFFHLFESMVNNMSHLVDRYSNHLIQ